MARRLQTELETGREGQRLDEAQQRHREQGRGETARWEGGVRKVRRGWGAATTTVATKAIRPRGRRGGKSAGPPGPRKPYMMSQESSTKRICLEVRLQISTVTLAWRR